MNVVTDPQAMSLVLATKTCSTCKRELPVSSFYREKLSPDGLRYSCKECTKEQSRASRERRRAKLGEEYYLAVTNAAVKRHRQRTGNAYDKLYRRATYLASKRLKELHQDEYEHLLNVARREVGL